ncbi:hypothetical protein HC028_10220 [Planosporangium flavigriseum]|uniref:hypothetical protein n=1 Tax=Planosporangium flavigriseum TaxID=373681 RepID=UPI00143B4927|nr:hypothetical protein [Planosporangium flavigriseum]NJC64875.1 hypothetical protein [Planosporangium flavigriseum]
MADGDADGDGLAAAADGATGSLVVGLAEGAEGALTNLTVVLLAHADPASMDAIATASSGAARRTTDRLRD